MRIAITGASRGLGLEFARLYLEAGHRVLALARNPEKSPGLHKLTAKHAASLSCIECDVADDGSVARAAAKALGALDGLDLLINNAGTYGPRDEGLATLDFAEMRRVFEVNSIGPLRVSRAFYPLLRQSAGAKLVQITSLMGSVEDNRSGGSWSYRMSKAALNMASRNLALELAGEKLIAVAIHPGWVKTDMGGAGAPLGIEEAVRSIIETIDRLEIGQSGGFFNLHGEPQPW